MAGTLTAARTRAERVLTANKVRTFLQRIGCGRSRAKKARTFLWRTPSALMPVRPWSARVRRARAVPESATRLVTAEPGNAPAFVARPFEGLASECDWVALREVVPAATAPLALRDGRSATLATVLPSAWAGLSRADGQVFLAAQTTTRSADVSRDLAWALLAALEVEPGNRVVATGTPGQGPRLQDLLTDAPLEVEVRTGFDFWVEGVQDPTGELALPRASQRLRRPDREAQHGRSRLLVSDPRDCAPAVGVAHGRGGVLRRGRPPARRPLARSRRGHPLHRGVPRARPGGPGLDLALGTGADAIEAPAAVLSGSRKRAAPRRRSDSEQRRARAGLVSRQITLR